MLTVVKTTTLDDDLKPVVHPDRPSPDEPLAISSTAFGFNMA
jgi:hypothetical protein